MNGVKQLRWILGAMALCVLATGATALAVTPIPVDKRIPATVIRTIAGPESDPLVMPTDLAIDSRGRIFVADGVNDRIVCFNANGKVDAILRGPTDAPLHGPIGVAVAKDDSLWITDTANHRVMIHTGDGSEKFLDLPNATNGKPANPTGIALTPDGKRTYIADCGNHRILIRDNATGSIATMGEWGTSLGQFRWPFMLCTGEDNHVLITETLGARVQQLSSTNRWGGQISQFGVALGDLYRPKGIVADAKGRIFVSDSTLNVVQAFDAGGNLLGVLTDDSGLPLRFAHPMGMRLDSSANLCIVELSANRIAIVSLKGPATRP
jgi:DNA-binding beta-propeller fold protein YncE